MSLTSFIHTSSKFFGLKIERTISSFGNNLAVYGIKKNDYNVNGDKINFKRLNIEIPKNKSLPILEGYENALKLINKEGVEFLFDKEDNLTIKIDNLKFVINDEEELFILCEVFLEGSYNLISPTQKEIVVIDIGMNVGITSMFYAAQQNVYKVFSFEPFSPTFNMALNNLRQNELYAHKVEMKNFGLGNHDSEIVVNYSLKQKGRMGLKGLPEKSNAIADNFRKEKIVLRSVNTEFKKIKEKNAHHFVVCKMDCEGAEYEIIDSLYKANLLSFPDVYFIEWHYKSPDDMVLSLIKNNYNVINTTFRTLNSGMIYAIKQ